MLPTPKPSPRMTAVAYLKHRNVFVFLVLPPDRLSTYSRWLRLLVRPLRPLDPPSPDGARRIRPSRRALHQPAGPDRHRKSHGTGDVHHHRRHGRAGIVPDQRTGHGRYESGRRSRKASRPATAQLPSGRGIETLATATDLSIRKIQEAVEGRASRGRVGEIVKQARSRNKNARPALAMEDHP